MKKLFKILLVLIFLMPYSFSLYAQESEELFDPNPELDSPIFEQETEEEDEEMVPLSDRLEREDESEVEEIAAPPPMSFFTVLAAILIPSIFIIICYLIFKFFKF